jgi:hypothetical protein
MNVKTLIAWVQEAQWAASEWRAESWRDTEMYDGNQWTLEDYNKAIDAGIDPLTINRTFPTINLLLGSEAINKNEMVAKARTQKDSEISQVMTESMKFIMDQSSGEFLVSEAFKDQIVPGFGCLSPCLNSDPRKEQLAVKLRDWKELWWDPFSPPWFDPEHTKYIFQQRWMDLSDLYGVFPDKKAEIGDKVDEISGLTHEYGSYMYDEATEIEENVRQAAGSGWVDSERKRVRPVEMWYPIHKKCMFAVFADGRVIEIDDEKQEIMQQFEIVQAAESVAVSIVKKMQVCTFLDELVLMSRPSPYPHDQYPFVPFVGYIDRNRQPYGVPRQIRGQDEEVNKRRSMALALLKSRRVIVEQDVVDGEKALQALYEEANKLDGFLVIKSGKSDRIQIQEKAELAQSQVALLQQSETEIQQISGPNNENMGYQSNAVSGVAIEKRQVQGATTTASLFNNLRRSLKLLGDQVMANIQGFWDHPKILRITDRMSGAERFVELNQKVLSEDGRPIEIKNNITQGKYDCVVSEAPQTDTVREQNMNLIIEWVKKSPPEIIPQLMHLAFEMSNLPNKEQLLTKLKPILGESPEDQDLSPEEIKQKVMEQLEQTQAQEQEAAEMQKLDAELELNKKRLENMKIQAEIEKIKAETSKKVNDAEVDNERIEMDQYKTGVDVADRMNQEATA